MFSMNCERHEGIKDLPYRVVFGRYPPVGIFPGVEKHCVDEEDLPITSTCDDPHTATSHTETSTDTATQNRQSSPTVRDNGNNAEGWGNLESPGSCVAPQSVSSPKDEVDADGEVEHTSTLKLPSQVSEARDKQQEEDDGDSKSTIHTAIREKVRDNTYLSATYMAVKYNKKKGVKTQVFSVGDKVTIGIPKMDRAKTDMPRLPCEITAVFGDKVMTYMLGTKF